MPNPDPRFTADEYARRLAKVRAAMEAAGIELLVVSDPSNMHWLTGYDGWSFYVHQAVIVPPTGNPVWYGRAQDAAGAERTSWLPDADIVGYPDDYVQSTERHPMDFLAGVLAAPTRAITAEMGSNFIIILFAVVVIGGLGSILGAVVTGFLVGLVEAYGVAYAPAYAQIVIFILMALVILVRPAGLFGREEIA